MRARVLTAAMGALLVSAAASAIDDADRGAVTETLARYAEAWAARDPHALAAHWDRNGADPLYIAEEVDDVFTSHTEIDAYWVRSFAYIEAIALGFGDPTFKPVGDDHLMATFDMRWDLKIVDGDAMGGDVRAVATFVRLEPSAADTDPDAAPGSHWKLTSWVEAPLAPVVYLRKLNAQSVRPQFLSTLRAETEPQGD